MDRGCREISAVIGSLAEGAEVSDDGGCRRRVTDVGVAFPHAVYTSVQMLENARKTAISRNFWGPSACLPRGTGSLRKSFGIQHIGTEKSPSGRSANLVAEGARNCNLNVRCLFSISVGSPSHPTRTSW